jgi:hypothetical protein
MKVFIKKSYLLVLFFFPIILFGQETSDYLKFADKIFPNGGIVLSKSSIHFTFQKEKRSKKIVASETREESFLSTKGEQKFSYVIHYDTYSEVEYFETSATVNDNYYKSQDIFHSDIRVKYANYKLRQRGVETSIKASKTYKDIKYLTRVYLTSPQNCLSRKVSFTIPETFDVELVPVNFDGHSIKVTDTKVGKNRVVEYLVENLEGYSDDSNLPGATYIYPHILILPKTFKDKNESKDFFNSVGALYSWYYKLISEVDNKPEELKEMVKELTSTAGSEEEKIKKIFYWVQDNIRYIAFEDGIAGYQPQNCQTVFFNRYGDCKGMANLMKEMLKIANFDARLVWLGTKSVATDYSTPCLASDNHMICAVKQGDDFLYLDGTEKYIMLGQYAERIQNQEVLIEDGKECIRKRIPVQDHLKNTRYFNLNLTMDEDQQLVGQVEMKQNGEAMSRIMYLYTRTLTDKKEESLKKYLAYHDDFTTIHEMEVPRMDRAIKELKLNGKIVMKNKVSSFDDETYVYLDPYKLYGSYDLGEERKFPLWISYKCNDKVSIKFEVPVGYEISSIPADFHAKNDDFQFDLEYKMEGSMISYQVQIQIPNSEVAAKNIKAWNKAIKALKEAYEEPIVLLKK